MSCFRGFHTDFLTRWISISKIRWVSVKRDHPGFKLRILGMFLPPRWLGKENWSLDSAYPLASLGHANWILRHYGYKAVFIWGLCLYGIGALIAWPCILKRSFGGFCGAIFIIGNGLGSLETAANPYITGEYFIFRSLNDCWLCPSMRTSSVCGDENQSLSSI